MTKQQNNLTTNRMNRGNSPSLMKREEYKNRRRALQESDAVKTRRSKKNGSASSTRTEAKADTNREKKKRLIPIWLRFLFILAFAFIALIGGMIIGYSVLGNGSAGDALRWDTWQHIIDLVKKP